MWRRRYILISRSPARLPSGYGVYPMRATRVVFKAPIWLPDNRKSAIENRKWKAEGVRFELTRPFGLPVFKTGAINRSATPPKVVISD